MDRIKFFAEITKTNVNIAGGKGASLGEMINASIPVPPGFVVLASAFDRFIDETNLKEEITARLTEVKPEDTASVDRASHVLRDAIHDTAMPADLGAEILRAFDTLFETPPNPPLQGEGHWVAVRSSATAEDSDVASWAGELETYLNTTREDVVERVKQCWSSLFTPRAIFYRHEKKLIDAHLSFAVVIKKILQSDISGVAFTVHPVTEDPNQMIIEAVYGLGEALVSGQVTPDSYIVSKNDMSIMDIHVGTQTKKLVKSEVISHKSEVNEWIELIETNGGKQKLSGKQIIDVAEMCKKIEEHYGFPCDIEWAMEAGKLYITQSRPITTLKQ